jgi:RING-variant domain
MVGDFMVCVDRIIASACFDTSRANETSGQAAGEAVEENKSRNCADKKRNSGKSKNKAGGEVVECRICQEEGEDGDMESPCACSGTLKVNFSFTLPFSRAHVRLRLSFVCSCAFSLWRRPLFASYFVKINFWGARESNILLGEQVKLK